MTRQTRCVLRLFPTSFELHDLNDKPISTGNASVTNSRLCTFMCVWFCVFYVEWRLHPPRCGSICLQCEWCLPRMTRQCRGVIRSKCLWRHCHVMSCATDRLRTKTWHWASYSIRRRRTWFYTSPIFSAPCTTLCRNVPFCLRNVQLRIVVPGR